MGGTPAFQFYPQDFLVGTAEMTAAEVGGYIRLLCYQWVKGGVTSDKIRLAQLAGCDVLEIETVMGKFEVSEDGMLRNKRLEIVRNERLEWVEKSRQGGIRSGEVRRTTLQPPFKPPYEPPPQPLPQPNANTSYSSSFSSSLSFSDSNKDKKRYVPTQEALELVEYLKTLILSHTPTAKINDSGWANDADRLLRLDKRPFDEAKNLLRWVHEVSDFWRPNILSMSKFRQKYDQLRLQMMRDTKISGVKPMMTEYDKHD